MPWSWLALMSHLQNFTFEIIPRSSVTHRKGGGGRVEEAGLVFGNSLGFCFGWGGGRGGIW